MRLLIGILFILLICGILFFPTGVPVRVFANANSENVPPPLLLAAKHDRLDRYAIRLALSRYVTPRGVRPPQPETLIIHILTSIRGHVFDGRDQMTAFALESAYFGRGIYGWETALSECLAKSPEEVTFADAATLMLHVRNPSAMAISNEDKLLIRRNRYLSDMAANGVIKEKIAHREANRPFLLCGKWKTRNVLRSLING